MTTPAVTPAKTFPAVDHPPPPAEAVCTLAPAIARVVRAKIIFFIICLSAYIITDTGRTGQFEFYSERSMDRIDNEL